MAESSSVRLFQQHLRQAGALLAARQFDVASKHIDAALAIDPASLAALTLRDRLMTLRAQTQASNPPARTSADARSDATPRFVPSGVNAASWIDFEQRIQERRFRGLIEAAERAVAGGDGVSARAAIEEARELQPDSGDLARLSARVALLQLPVNRPPEGFFRSRTFRAASLLLLGIMSLMGLDWVRSGTPPTNGTRGTIAVPASDAPASTTSASATSVPAAPQNSAVPESRGTSGQAPEPLPLTFKSVASSSRPAPVITSPSAPERPLASSETPDDYVIPSSASPLRATVQAPPIVRGEVSDDYVAPRRETVRETTPVTGRPPIPSVPLASIVRTPSTIEIVGNSAAGAAAAPPVLPAAANATPVVAPVIAPAGASEDSRISALVNQYASAYGQLNAAAVRSIWPSVDERALAKAFANLSSQSMTFDGCDINVSGATARALCRGRASYVVKVGSQEKRNEPRTVRFDFKRDGDNWKILKAETTR